MAGHILFVVLVAADVGGRLYGWTEILFVVLVAADVGGRLCGWTEILFVVLVAADVGGRLCGWTHTLCGTCCSRCGRKALWLDTDTLLGYLTETLTK